jgi:hypothetical protein
MTGIAWLDWLGVVVFALLAVVSAARVWLGWRSISDRSDVVQHGVMAAGMGAMSWPTGHLLPPVIGVLIFAAAGCWSLQVLVRRVGPWRGLDRRRTEGPWWRRSDGAAHHLLACVVMIIAFGGGHAGYGGENASMATGAAAHDMDHDMDVGSMGHDMDVGSMGHDMVTGTPGMAGPTSAHGAEHESPLPAVVDDMIETASGWPIWPMAGAGFVVYALWITMGRADRAVCPCATAGVGSGNMKTGRSWVPRLIVAPLLERWSAAVMAAGMGVMTLAL